MTDYTVIINHPNVILKLQHALLHYKQSLLGLLARYRFWQFINSVCSCAGIHQGAGGTQGGTVTSEHTLNKFEVE